MVRHRACIKSGFSISEQGCARVLSLYYVFKNGDFMRSVEQALRNCVKAADAGKWNKSGDMVVMLEQMELSRLRAESIRL